MSESLRNDGRIWVPKKAGDKRSARSDSGSRIAITIWSASIPSFGNLVPRDVASRNAKAVCDEGRGVGETGLGVYLDFSDAIQRLGADVIRDRYGNLFEMYQRITDEDPYKVPMRIYPGDPLHHGRPVGGLLPDEHHPGPVRDRRSELFRSRREPFGRQRADAGACRTAISSCPTRSAITSPRPSSTRSTATHPEVRRVGSAASTRSTKTLLNDQRQAHGGFVPSRAGQNHVGLVRDGADGARAWSARSSRFASCARNTGRT